MACAYPHYDDRFRDTNGNLVPIPCGHCFCCRLDNQREAVDRMFCAYYLWPCSAFVTLTYDEANLVYTDGFTTPSLSKDDLRKYLDNLRHRVPDIKFDYYACGEYGDSFGRPHYHVIFFGLDYLLHARVIRSCWSKGMVKILPCNSGSFRYLAKYLTKQNDREYLDRNYFDFGLIPPFRKFSRGLGVSPYLDHIDEIARNGFFWFHGRKIQPTRYFFNKIVHRDDYLLMVRENLKNDYRRKSDEVAASFGLGGSTFRHKNVSTREESLMSKNLREANSLNPC